MGWFLFQIFLYLKATSAVTVAGLPYILDCIKSMFCTASILAIYSARGRIGWLQCVDLLCFK